MQRIGVALALLACGLALVEAQECLVCQTDNDVYCYNQTSYQFCSGTNLFGTIQNCPTGTVCSNSDDVCVASSAISDTVLDVCGSSGGNGADCGDCSAGSKYVCVSQTQFARCVSSAVSAVFECATDEICSYSQYQNGYDICVPSCAADYLKLNATCSNSEYTTTTTTAAPATTPSATELATACTNAVPSSNPGYFYTRNYDDVNCHTYIYCQSSGTDSWVTVFLTCKSNLYYDSTTNKCVETWPASCS
ncbi:hypothetical protein KR074_004983, partial [Drosophila pseudoananassae]